MFIKLSANILNKFNKTIECATYRYSTQTPVCEEIRIPVPWGHLAGKWWGPHDKRPILTVHGWQDNCGSFDRLIPYLNKNLSFLALDFPGHGLSSQLPQGLFYHWSDYILAVKRVVDYFQWQKVSLMGHSLGGIVSYVYTTLYPDTVDFLISFDALRPLQFNVKRIRYMGKDVEDFLKYELQNRSEEEPPSYSLEELEHKLHEGSGQSIALNSCKYILQRGMEPSAKIPNKFYYKRDGRLKVLSLLDPDEKDITENASRLTCPTMLCLAKHRSRKYRSLEQAHGFYEMIQERNKNFEIHHVAGTHHVHLNNPEVLEGLVNAFIKKYDTGDRSVGGLRQEIRVDAQS